MLRVRGRYRAVMTPAPDPSASTIEDVRLAIYSSFARDGRPPSEVDLGGQLDLDPEVVRASIAHLARARHVVVDDAGRIVMAHPFAAVPLGFSVMGAATLWWGGCAWDSFALVHILTEQPSVLVASTCPGCSAPHAWTVRRDAPPAGEQVAHFLVPAARMWDDVLHTCANQRLFCGPACVQRWLDRTDNAQGYVMDLDTLWRLAADWYTGRLERGYTRREPSAAADYLRSVGLSGPFWGL